jgi:hypothetical protein
MIRVEQGREGTRIFCNYPICGCPAARIVGRSAKILLRRGQRIRTMRVGEGEGVDDTPTRRNSL